MASSPSYRALLDSATRELFTSSDSPRIDAEVLMQHVLGKPLAWLIAHGETMALAEHIRHFSALVEQRRRGQPVAYLVGYKEFWSLRLTVNQHVLIPRPDTETLVEQALSLLREDAAPAILDLGTGSGAIALALASELPQASVLGIDTSPAALEVARQNAVENQLENVVFEQGSWYSTLGDKRFDLIAANPPYIAKNDPHLQQGDLRFEPPGALSADAGGYADISEIIRQAPVYLRASGALIIEHGHLQADEVGQLFSKAGFTDIRLHKDLNKLPRCTAGILGAAK